MPRLFFAVDIPDAIKRLLAPRAASMRDLGRHVRPVRGDGFHTTLLFLGDQPSEAIEGLSDIATALVANARPCRLEIGPVGFFPRVSFLTLKGEIETLVVLASALAESCENYLAEPETRAYKAHVTVARHKKKLGRGERERITRMFAEFEGMEWTSTELILFESELTPGGAIYTVVGRFPFGEG